MHTTSVLSRFSLAAAMLLTSASALGASAKRGVFSTLPDGTAVVVTVKPESENV